jgi:hypothetical protein
MRHDYDSFQSAMDEFVMRPACRNFFEAITLKSSDDFTAVSKHMRPRSKLLAEATLISARDG